MFGGKETLVTMQCEEEMAGVMIDRFGKEVSVRQIKPGQFQVRTEIAVSPPFFGWLAGMGGKVKIIAPNEVAQEAKNYLKAVLEQWDEKEEK